MSSQLKAKFKTARMNMAKFSEIACNILDREIILLLISLTLLSQAKKTHFESLYREPALLVGEYKSEGKRSVIDIRPNFMCFS